MNGHFNSLVTTVFGNLKTEEKNFKTPYDSWISMATLIDGQRRENHIVPDKTTTFIKNELPQLIKAFRPKAVALRVLIYRPSQQKEMVLLLLLDAKVTEVWEANVGRNQANLAQLSNFVQMPEDGVPQDVLLPPLKNLMQLMAFL